MKAVTILERASKMALLDPAEDSEHAKAWTAYAAAAAIPHNSGVSATLPPPWLEQPKYRVPVEYAAVRFAVEQMQTSMGDDGVFPLDRSRREESDNPREEADPTPAFQPVVTSQVIIMVCPVTYTTCLWLRGSFSSTSSSIQQSCSCTTSTQWNVQMTRLWLQPDDASRCFVICPRWSVPFAFS